MATTTAPQTAGIELLDPDGLDPDGLDPDGLDADGVLGCVGDAETAERRAGLAKLELGLRWCVLHPATEESGTAVWGDAGIPGLDDCEESLGGEGCPPVAAFAPEPFAAALGVSTFTGMQVLADALDLAHRLPKTWARVRRLEVAPWRARRLAQATRHLSRDAARFVDARVVARIDSCGAVLIDRTIAQAAARFDPEAQREAEQAGKGCWDVRLLTRTDGGFAGTSHLDATGDTADLTRFYDLVCDQAAHLARLGDTDPLGARKAKALGVIADTQAHLDLDDTDPASGNATGNATGKDTDEGVGSGTASDKQGERVRVRRPSLAKTRFYLHLGLTDLINLPDGLVRVGEVEQLGPVTTARIKEWVGATRVTVVPVLHLGEPGDHPGEVPGRGLVEPAVDRHDPPEAMREAVIVRDGHCVFPWCRVDARSCDLDHITSYVPINEGGPPGQTAPSKLACLCRRHHRAKTARRWSYQRNRDGTYTWNGPHNRSYLVTPLGTQALPHA